MATSLIDGAQRLVYIYGKGLIFRFLHHTRHAPIRRLLYIESAGFGDSCLLAPFVNSLTGAGYAVDIVCLEAALPLWRRVLPPASLIAGFPRGRWTAAGVAVIERALRGRAYAAVFSVTGASAAAYFATIPRSGVRIGIIEGKARYKGSRILYDRMYRCPGSVEHVQDRLPRQFSLFAPPPPPLDFILPANNRDAPRFCLLHPGAKWRPRRWPAERFAQLASRCAGKGIPVKISVPDAEHDLRGYFAALPPTPGVEVVATRDIGALMDLTARCAVFVGNDSGPAHLANLYRLPLVVLWGPARRCRIEPRGGNVRIIMKDVPCRPCRQYRGNPDRCRRGEPECLLSITVEEVFNEVQRLWTTPAGPA